MVFSTEPHSDACPSDRERGLTKHLSGQEVAWAALSVRMRLKRRASLYIGSVLIVCLCLSSPSVCLCLSNSLGTNNHVCFDDVHRLIRLGMRSRRR